jgi:hypothetical protein
MDPFCDCPFIAPLAQTTTSASTMYIGQREYRILASGKEFSGFRRADYAGKYGSRI